MLIIQYMYVLFYKDELPISIINLFFIRSIVTHIIFLLFKIIKLSYGLVSRQSRFYPSNGSNPYLSTFKNLTIFVVKLRFQL